MDYKELIKKHLENNVAEVKEEDMKVCKICNTLKKRILAGKFDTKNKKWVDENDKLWNGRVCPNCQNESAKNNMRKLRNKVENNE